MQYCPALLGVARLHYADKKAGIDQWETLTLVRRINEILPPEVWMKANRLTILCPSSTRRQSLALGSQLCLASLPKPRAMASGPRGLKNYLYRERALRLWSCPAS